MTRDELHKLADLAGWTTTQREMASKAEWARLERFAAAYSKADHTMTRDQKLAHIQAWHDAMIKAEDTIKPVIDALGLCGDDPITNTVWQLQTDLTRAYAALIDDAFESLSWYAHENDMGRNGMNAGIPGDMRPIRTAEDLLWLIEVTD